MNNKITFQRLASLVADKSGRSKRFSEDFLREFFALIAEQLETGGSVKVKGLGTFRLIKVEPRKSVDVTTGQPMEISGHSKVVFTPAKDLAEAVNAPFQAFSAIEIGDDVDISGIVDGDDIEVDVDSEEIALAVSPDDVPLFDGTEIAAIPAASVGREEMPDETGAVSEETGVISDEIETVADGTGFSSDEAVICAPLGDRRATGVDADQSDEAVICAPLGDRRVTGVDADQSDGAVICAPLGDRRATGDDADYSDEVIDDDSGNISGVGAEEASSSADDAGQAREVAVSDKRYVDDADNTDNTGAADDADDDFTIEEGNFGNGSDSRRRGSYRDYVAGPRRRWSKSLLIGAACAVAAVVITFIIWSVATKPVFREAGDEDVVLADFGKEPAEELTSGDIDPVGAAVIADTLPDDGAGELSAAELVPTAPSDAVVYDTIGKTRYLTTMAKAHYGSNKFWPYIYEENKGNIGHPDKIRPGTPIVIPKLSKYGVDPDNPADVEKANKLAVEIYARYGKSI